jgi:outer membrane murein-binding lipoprotein Lpp
MGRVSVGIIGSLLLAGCTQQNTGDAALRAQVEKLDARLSTTEAELNDLKNRQQSTDGEVLGLKLNAQAGQMAVFDPVSGQGYVAMDAGVGKLMVSIEDIEPYADGVKVRLAVGNPNAVTLNGLRGEATYGPASSRIGAIPAGEWSAKQHTIQLTLPDSLTPARWNKVTITLPGIAASDFGRLTLSLAGNQVQMMR